MASAGLATDDVASERAAGAAAPARVVVVGAGRMGALVGELIDKEDGFERVATLSSADVGELDEGLAPADLVIDFSAPEALAHVAAYVRRTGAALVSGTTGLDAAQMGEVRALGEVARVVHASNFSLGVAVLRRLVAEAARALSGFDVEIVETHHNQKVDAPSGTAKALLDAVDPQGLDAVAYGREGVVGPRPAHEVGMHSLRGGTVAGTHTVCFFGTDEEVELTHRATSRTIFAAGAVAAARALLAREAGLYTFEDLMLD